jgi:hypothetical protein
MEVGQGSNLGCSAKEEEEEEDTLIQCTPNVLLGNSPYLFSLRK